MLSPPVEWCSRETRIIPSQIDGLDQIEGNYSDRRTVPEIVSKYPNPGHAGLGFYPVDFTI